MEPTVSGEYTPNAGEHASQVNDPIKAEAVLQHPKRYVCWVGEKAAATSR